MEDDAYLPLSALAHMAFCERRAALVHVDGIWEENADTTLGRILHERVDTGETTHAAQGPVLRRVWLRSDRLRMRGLADVVEIRGPPEARTYFLVEYKKGGPRADPSYAVQLCAQAIALEEMTGSRCGEGALFLGRTRRRKLVRFDAPLRARVERLAARLHEMVSARRVPPPVLDARCGHCSLRPRCMPEAPRSTMLVHVRRALEQE